MIPRKPKYPVGLLVTWELREYKLKLESALREMPEHDSTRVLVEGRLAEVISEQEARTKDEDEDRERARAECGAA